MNLKNNKINNSIISIGFLMFLSFQVTAVHQDTRQSELEFANKNLNVIYQKILNKLHPSDQIKLKRSQRAWIGFRDLDCAWAYSAEPMDCMIDRTESRTKELERTEFFNSKGDYLSIENQIAAVH